MPVNHNTHTSKEQQKYVSKILYGVDWKVPLEHEEMTMLHNDRGDTETTGSIGKIRNIKRVNIKSLSMSVANPAALLTMDLICTWKRWDASIRIPKS